MPVRKVKKSWHVDISWKTRRYRPISPHNSKASAEAFEAFLRRELAQGKDIAEKLGHHEETFESFASRWYEEYVVSNNKPSEQKNKRYALASSLIPFFGKMRISEIRATHITQYIGQLNRVGLSHKTINNRLAMLSKLLKDAYESLQLETTIPKIKLLKCPPPNPRHLTPKACRLLVLNAQGLIREMILLILKTGMRQGEVRGLQWESIDWENHTLVVRHSQDDYVKALLSPKSNRPRVIPLHSDVYDMLLLRKRETGYVFLNTDGQPFTQKTIASGLTRVCERAGLERITWHVLRHSFATNLALTEQTPVLQALLGHSSVITTMRYVHVVSESLRAAVDSSTLGSVNLGNLPSTNV